MNLGAFLDANIEQGQRDLIQLTYFVRFGISLSFSLYSRARCVIYNLVICGFFKVLVDLFWINIETGHIDIGRYVDELDNLQIVVMIV